MRIRGTDEGTYFSIGSGQFAGDDLTQWMIGSDNQDRHVGDGNARRKVGSRAPSRKPEYHAPMRLTPPTTGTFTLSVLAILAGIAAHLGYLDALVEYEFWLVAGGAGLLVLGVLFRKL
jgi:hypothetical protein